MLSLISQLEKMQTSASDANTDVLP
jgi:hypothetical protein